MGRKMETYIFGEVFGSQLEHEKILRLLQICKGRLGERKEGNLYIFCLFFFFTKFCINSVSNSFIFRLTVTITL